MNCRLQGSYFLKLNMISFSFQALFKAGKYDEVLKIIRDKKSNLRIDELFDSGVGLIHLAAASGSLVYS